MRCLPNHSFASFTWRGMWEIYYSNIVILPTSLYIPASYIPTHLHIYQICTSTSKNNNNNNICIGMFSVQYGKLMAWHGMLIFTVLVNTGEERQIYLPLCG